LFSKTILFLILHSRGLPAITWQPRLALPFGYPSTSRPVPFGYPSTSLRASAQGPRSRRGATPQLTFYIFTDFGENPIVSKAPKFKRYNC